MKKSVVFPFFGVIALVLSNGRWAVPELAWLAPIPLLAVIRTARPWIGLPVAAVVFAGAARVMLYGIVPSFLGGLGWLLTSYYGLLWFIPYLLDGLLNRRPKAFVFTLAFPCASVGVEYLNAVALGHWGSTAVTQFDNLPLLQVLSLTGLWGITFLVAWFGPVVLWVRENGFEWKRVRGGMAVFSGALAVVLFYGGLRLALVNQPGPAVRVASLHLDDESMKALAARLPGRDSPPGELESAREKKARALDLYLERSARLARQGASVIFWPETAVRVGRDREPDLLARAAGLAAAEKVYFMPAYYLEPGADGVTKGENMCVLLDPSGRVVWRYVKARPVPGSPDAPGGQDMPVTETPFGRLAAAICYDLDFPQFVRRAGRAKADIVLVPAWDWKAIDPLHSRMAACRAVENGFSMVRHSAEGLSLAVDSLGRTRGAMDHFQSADRVMLVDVPARRVPTLYAKVGDVLAWLALAGLAGFAASAVVRRRRPGAVRLQAGPAS